MDNKWQVVVGNNIDVLKTYEDNTYDSIITDPPYGIEFLGKDWDKDTGSLDTWRECLRVLKPGGYLLAFSAARTYHHLATNIEMSGFEIRDQLQWIYSTGFPKAQKIEGFDGWKTALKPAHEPIVMARKPLSGTHKQNMDTWGVGALNIDATRVGMMTEEEVKRSGKSTNGMFMKGGVDWSEGKEPQGRFPSNVIGEIPDYQKFFYCPKVSRKERQIGFSVKTKNTRPRGEAFGDSNLLDENKTGNNHPTVKPVELMKYLIKLVTPPNGVVLDPFNGSGSTGMAAVELGHHYVGCELDPDYAEIARTRIREWERIHNTPANNLFD